MSLFTITIIVALIFIAKGLIWYLAPTWTDHFWRATLRNSTVAYITFGLASLWFLWEVAHLGEADFGQYKNWLFVIFAAIAVCSFLFLKDFLAVRGLAILQLLISKYILDIAYMQEPLSRLFLVSLVYVLILEALYFGALPFRLRDFLNWVFISKSRINKFAIAFIAYGVILLGAAFTY